MRLVDISLYICKFVICIIHYQIYEEIICCHGVGFRSCVFRNSGWRIRIKGSQKPARENLTPLSTALFETDYRVHLVERTHCATESDYDTEDLIEDARNFVITAKRYFCSFVSLELHVYRQ